MNQYSKDRRAMPEGWSRREDDTSEPIGAFVWGVLYGILFMLGCVFVAIHVGAL